MAVSSRQKIWFILFWPPNTCVYLRGQLLTLYPARQQKATKNALPQQHFSQTMIRKLLFTFNRK